MTDISSVDNVRRKAARNRSRSTRRYLLWRASKPFLNFLYKINGIKDPSFSAIPLDIIASAVDTVNLLRIDSDPEAYKYLKRLFKEYPWFADLYIKHTLEQSDLLFRDNGVITTDDPTGTYTGFL